MYHQNPVGAAIWFVQRSFRKSMRFGGDTYYTDIVYGKYSANPSW